MRLESIAAKFDTTPMWDAYSGRKLKAKCQVTLWDSPRRDGLTTIRRTFSVNGKAKLPDRHAVIVGGTAWIISNQEAIDTWGKFIIRKGLIAQQATLGYVATTEEVLSDSGVEVYMSRVWVKDVKDISTTSEQQGQYNIYFTRGEAVQQGGFIYLDGLWHIVRNVMVGASGFMIAECNELEEDATREVLLVSEDRYDPVTERRLKSETSIPCILMEWSDDYTLGLPSRDKEQIGDKRLRVPKTYAGLIRYDSRFDIDGVSWQATDVEQRADGSVSVAIRRV